MDADPLAPEILGPILAPFSSCGPGIALRVEAADGRVIGSAGAAADSLPGGRVSIHEVHGGPAGKLIGRVVGQGEGAIIDAIVASLAASITALAAASHAHDPDDETSHRIEAELALGRRIQRSFVPLTVPEIPGYEVASHYEAAREVGGDFFDVFRPRGRAGRLAIVVADVTGKGIAAALLMAFARPLLHAAIDHAGEPVEALRRTNRILVEERRSSLFITALCVMVELQAAASGSPTPATSRR